MGNDQHIITKSAEETAAFGQSLGFGLAGAFREGEVPDAHRVYCLHGQLGAGKTTFTQGFAQGLGVRTRLPSPTFIIVRRYSLQSDYFFYHIDLYRLGDPKESETLGLAEILSDSKSCVVIEWAEKLGDMMPRHRTDIYFSENDSGAHILRMEMST